VTLRIRSVSRKPEFEKHLLQSGGGCFLPLELDPHLLGRDADRRLDHPRNGSQGGLDSRGRVFGTDGANFQQDVAVQGMNLGPGGAGESFDIGQAAHRRVVV